MCVSFILQNEDFVKSLSKQLGSPGPGSTNVTVLIINTVTRIKNVQCLSVSKECERNILNRGIERNVILKRDSSIQNIVSNLLNSQFHDKDGVMQFQHFMYKNLMALQVKGIEKEVVALNCLSSKQRRILKSITTNSIFKLCSDFLNNDKASCSIRFGRENELVWKAALVDKNIQTESMDKWLKMVATVTSGYSSGDVFIDETFSSMNGLKISKIERISINPGAFEVMAINDDDIFNLDELKVIDEDIMNNIKEVSDERTSNEKMENAEDGTLGKVRNVLPIAIEPICPLTNPNEQIKELTNASSVRGRHTNERIKDTPSVKSQPRTSLKQIFQRNVTRKESYMPAEDVNVHRKDERFVRNTNENEYRRHGGIREGPYRKRSGGKRTNDEFTGRRGRF